MYWGKPTKKLQWLIMPVMDVEKKCINHPPRKDSKKEEVKKDDTNNMFLWNCSIS